MKKNITEILMDELDNLLSGKTDYKRANAVAKLSAQVIYKERIEVEKDTLKMKIEKRSK